MQIKTAGDLRGFLADVMIGIKNGSVEPGQAHAIAKMAAQINQSLAVEVNTALQLERMGKDHPIAGSMLIGRADDQPFALENQAMVMPPEAGVEEMVETREAASEPTLVAPKSLDDATANFLRNQADREGVWCDQCDMSVTVSQAISCKSRFCKAKEAA